MRRLGDGVRVRGRGPSPLRWGARAEGLWGVECSEESELNRESLSLRARASAWNCMRAGDSFGPAFIPWAVRVGVRMQEGEPVRRLVTTDAKAVLRVGWGHQGVLNAMLVRLDPNSGLSLKGGEKRCLRNANRNERSRGRSLLLGQDTGKTQGHRNSIEQQWLAVGSVGG